LYLLNEKTEFILSTRLSARNPGFLLIITGWGGSGKVILQVSIGVFQALSKNFSGKDGSAPLEKICPYTYGTGVEIGFQCVRKIGGH